MSPEPDPRPAPIPDATPSASPAETEPPLVEAERVPSRPPARSPRGAVARMAWAVAIATDAIQWVLLPLFAAGAISPIDDALDVIAAAVLIRLLGWHWAFLPAFIAEIIPGANLVPTWTAAVFLATRGRGSAARGGEQPSPKPPR